jgi:DNA-binding response OmpR family regulator
MSERPVGTDRNIDDSGHSLDGDILIVENDDNRGETYHSGLDQHYSVRQASTVEKGFSRFCEEVNLVRLAHEFSDRCRCEAINAYRKAAGNCSIMKVADNFSGFEIINQGFDAYLTNLSHPEIFNEVIKALSEKDQTSLASIDGVLN